MAVTLTLLMRFLRIQNNKKILEKSHILKQIKILPQKKILPLHGACEEKKVENVRILIQNGAMIFARTAVCFSLSLSKNNQNSYILKEGSMALHLACKSGSKEIVELLLEAGAQKRINAYGKVKLTFKCSTIL